MNLVDSCGWIEYFADSPLAEFYSGPIERLEELIIPVVCILEVFKKISAERDENSALMAVAHMRQGKVIPLTESLALAAAALGLELNLPLADSIIYATGRAAGAVIYTQNSHFRGLEKVSFLDLDL